MSRLRYILPIILLSLLAISCQSENKRPNILLIVSEDNGPELSCYGEPYVKTPVLDHFATEGVLFKRAFVPQAGCSQSRAALLTGLYPHQNGQIGLATWKFRLYDQSTPNLVRCLKETGYRTGIIGKLHINPESAFPFDYKKIPSANFARKDISAYAKEAGTFINQSDQPFFLSVNFPDAHRPFTPQVEGLPDEPLTADEVRPLAYFGLDSPDLRQQTANYYNCMVRLDAQIGDLLQILDESGKRDNTLVIYLGDHGADLLRGKRTSYEGGLRIPLIVRWPGKVPKEKIREELVSTLDLMPTILEAAGAEIPTGLPGRSLLDLFDESEVEWRKYLFTEFQLHSAHNYFPQRTVRDSRYKLIHNLIPGMINPGYAFTLEMFFPDIENAINTAPEKVQSAYRIMERPPEFELYDLDNDPYEFTNLASHSGHQLKLKELREVLLEWRQQSSDPFLKEENVYRLKREIDASFREGKPNKEHLHLSYLEYFFED